MTDYIEKRIGDYEVTVYSDTYIALSHKDWPEDDWAEIVLIDNEDNGPTLCLDSSHSCRLPVAVLAELGLTRQG